MDQKSLFRIKQFIRVSQEIETALNVTVIQKKILLTLIDLCDQNKKSIPMRDLIISIKDVSERSVFRHLNTLISQGWIKLSPHHIDGRVKLITPTPKLLKVLSSQI
jgi:DNA-binding MarR family transcriptional regulator